MPRMAITIDTTTSFGQRAERRLREELIGWLVTVTPSGQPQPIPIWFEWDGASVLFYSKPEVAKLRNIAASSKVSLHLDGDGQGSDIVVMSGTAAISDDPPADQVATYVAKYHARMARNGWTPEHFAGMYSVPLRIEPTRLHGW